MTEKDAATYCESELQNTTGVEDSCVGFCIDNLVGDHRSSGVVVDSAVDGGGCAPDAAQRMHVEMTSRKWHGIKQSLELIRNSYRTCIITADDKLFQIMAYDNKGHSLGFLLRIPTSNIEPYTCVSPISISVSTMRISEIIRQVRKSETVMFYVDAVNQVCGILSNSTTGHARKRETSVSVVQLTYFDGPTVAATQPEPKPFVVATSDFGRMLKVYVPVESMMARLCGSLLLFLLNLFLS